MKALLTLFALTTFLAPASSDPEYRAEVEAWHEGRIERLRQPGSWLSLVALIAIPEGRSSLGCDATADLVIDAGGPAHIGDLVTEGATVQFVAAADVTHDGEPVDTIELGPDVSGNPTVLRCGSLSFYLILRHDRPYLRVKDSEAELLQTFPGIERWPVDPEWRIEAEWVEYDEPVVHAFPDVMGLAEETEVIGEARFEIDGKTYALIPNDVYENSIFWVFGDATNGVESYGAGRFLYSGLPDEDGRVVLDFNLSYNPPCVFTPYATCPLPIEENILDVEITAGEKNYGAPH